MEWGDGCVGGGNEHGKEGETSEIVGMEKVVEMGEGKEIEKEVGFTRRRRGKGGLGDVLKVFY